MTTSCHDHAMITGHNHPAGATFDPLGVLKSAALWPVRVLRARRELDVLAGLSELELKDIGLTHSDIGDATALPPSASPTNFLAARVEERYRARHRD